MKTKIPRDWNRMQNVHPGVRVVFEIGYPGEIGLRYGVIFVWSTTLSFAYYSSHPVLMFSNGSEMQF